MAYGLSHHKVYEMLVKTILEGAPAPVEFEDGLNTIRLLHALYRSNEEKRWVRLDEHVESKRLGERNDKLLAQYLI